MKLKKKESKILIGHFDLTFFMLCSLTRMNFVLFTIYLYTYRIYLYTYRIYTHKGLKDEGFLPGRIFTRKDFHQEGFLPGRIFTRKDFYQGGFLPGRG